MFVNTVLITDVYDTSSSVDPSLWQQLCHFDRSLETILLVFKETKFKIYY